ncbi:RDD family protein [Tessaracoccus sp.]
MSFSADLPPAGWYPDPAGSGGERYWDGGTWSQVTRPAGGMAPAYMPQGQSAPYSAYGQQGPGPMMGRGVLAGFWWRVLATILDNLILLIPLGMVQRLVAGDAIDGLSFWLSDWALAVIEGVVPPAVPEGLLSPLYLYVFVSMVLLVAYRTVMVVLKGGTLGQLVAGLRVVPDGSPLETTLSWGTSGMRAVTAVVFGQLPILNLVDPLSMLFSAKKQTLHDRIARTVVIKK